MSDHQFAINVGIVTYSDRWSFLAPVIERALRTSSGLVIVVINGSPLSVVDRLLELSNDSQRLRLIRHSENLGSAGGFKALINYASDNCSNASLLLLDDDNLLPLDWQAHIGSGASEYDQIIMISRADRGFLSEARDAGEPWRPLGSKNSFLGRDLFSGIFPSPEPADSDLLAAPYSGLILPKSVLQKRILPNDSLFLYGDDSEYTYRLVRRYGYSIRLIDETQITDIETSFHLTVKEGFLSNRYVSSDSFRLFFSVRNQIILGRKRYSSRLIFGANTVLVTAYLILGFMLRGQWKKIGTYCHAVAEAYRFGALERY